ncbi:hypothetical protein [Sorangium sp. So ce145]|uniref:hypothetical protein n=1 Tax=Sorangium sp. So ce145 TaxID=3133285 RepID=UPI003F5FC1FB
MTSSQRIWVGPLDAEAAREVAAQGAAAHVEQVLEEVGGFAYGLQWLGERLLKRLGSPRRNTKRKASCRLAVPCWLYLPGPRFLHTP